MKKNMGTADRLIRLIVALAIVILLTRFPFFSRMNLSEI